VGKTTCAINIGAGLNKLNKRVLLIGSVIDVTINSLMNVIDNKMREGIINFKILISSPQSLLGHGRLATTEIYLNLSPEDAIREFLNKW